MRQTTAISDRLTGRAALVILLLTLINIVNFVDRQLPFILISSIKAELKLTDTQIGLMTGVTFAVFYSFAGLLLAWLADRWSPRYLLAITLGMWSVMTAMGGVARNFTHMIVARSGVALGESGCTPAAHALISRAFSPERRGLVLALFSLGVPIGSMIGLAGGGWINDVASWRTAFFIVGLPGLLLALLAWWILPDLRASTDAHDPARFWSSLKTLFAFRSFRHMAAASSLYACGSYAMNVFASAFLIRTYGLTTAQAGLGFGLAFGFGGIAGTFLGGWLADTLGKRDPRWFQRIPALGQLLSFPTAIGAWLAPNAPTAVALIALSYTFGLCYFAPSFATAQALASDRTRATASAVLLFCLTIVGSSVGPLAVGWASDRLTPHFHAQSLRYAMCLMGITILWSAWHYWLASRALPADLAKETRQPA